MKKFKFKVSSQFMCDIELISCHWDVTYFTKLTGADAISATLSCAATHKHFKLGYKDGKLAVQETYYKLVKSRYQ